MEYYFIVVENIILMLGFFGIWLYKKKGCMEDAKTPELYSDYLSSKKWEDLRRVALERSNYKCELCDSPYKAVHHIKYPKKYKNDHLDNLLVVCDKCHAKLHGIRDVTAFQESEKISEQVMKSEILYKEEFKAGSRFYYFQVKKLTDNKKYLQIIEKGKRGEQKIEIEGDLMGSFNKKITQGLSLLKDKREINFEEKITIDNGSYFFEIKYAVNNSKYLKITESKRKENSFFESSCIMVFEDEEKIFSVGLQNSVNFL